MKKEQFFLFKERKKDRTRELEDRKEKEEKKMSTVKKKNIFLFLFPLSLCSRIMTIKILRITTIQIISDYNCFSFLISILIF